MIGFAGIEILDAMVEETPFPDHRPGHVHFDNRVHLGVRVCPAGRVATSPEAGCGRNRFGGDVKCRVRPEFPVPDSQEIMVRLVAGACLRMLPDRFAIPIHFRKPRKPVHIPIDRIQDIPVLQQMGVRTQRPLVDDLPFHIHQVGVAPDTEKSVSGHRLGFVPVDYFCRALEPFIGLQRGGAKHEANGRQDCPCKCFHDLSGSKSSHDGRSITACGRRVPGR